ncbi:MAG: nuclease A inhibitor family protein [Gemmatimonadaceae bacterium]
MGTERSATIDDLRGELERASRGLVYSSESDRPFEFFSLPYPGKRATPSAAEFARLIGAPPDLRAEVRSLDDFFARHTTTSDPYDSGAQKIRPSYEELVRVISRRLRDVKVYRIGTIEVACYIAGLDASGNLAGLKTIAIET